MRFISILFCFLLCIFSDARNLGPGTSTALFTGFSLENLEYAKNCGFETLEYGISKSLMDKTPSECRDFMKSVSSTIRKSGLKLWSCHLPFGRDIDISIADSAKRRENVENLVKIIRAAKVLKPKCLVIHPSYEPIKDSEREMRMRNSIQSIGLLNAAAKEIGAVLCVENLPRTCIGKNSGEIGRLIASYPDVMVCFDVNHLLEEDVLKFAEAIGDRIATLHISDYDKVNERHWIPGQGIIDWDALYDAIVSTGYSGPWMFETVADRDKTGKDSRATPGQLMESYRKVVSGKSKRY